MTTGQHVCVDSPQHLAAEGAHTTRLDGMLAGGCHCGLLRVVETTQQPGNSSDDWTVRSLRFCWSASRLCASSVMMTTRDRRRVGLCAASKMRMRLRWMDVATRGRRRTSASAGTPGGSGRRKSRESTRADGRLASRRPQIVHQSAAMSSSWLQSADVRGAIRNGQRATRDQLEKQGHIDRS